MVDSKAAAAPPNPLFLLLLFLCFAFLPCPSHSNPVPPPPGSSFSSSPSPPPPQPSSSGMRTVLLSVVLGILAGLTLALLVAFAIRCFFLPPYRRYVRPPAAVFSPKIDLKSLHLALSNQNHLLGSSPNGSYYRTTLDNGLTVAVKRLHPIEIDTHHHVRRSSSLKRKLQLELQVLAGLRHRHLMSLRAYVRQPDGHFLLVYDYMPAGSLRDAMDRVRQNQLQLGWEARLRIAVGIVKGLKFLHFDCTPRVLHHDLKPSNVMLDAEFEPRLADSGLAKLMLLKSNAYGSPPTFDGYRAPESCQNCRYTDKSDIYSFGVILAVLLTGRDPVDPFFSEAGNGGSLGRWLRQLQQAGDGEARRQALDKSSLLLGIGEGGGAEEGEEEEEMLMALRIAGVCMSDFPADRPSSDELVPMLSQLHSF
ncbi:hypothetical protein Dimus_031610 [Dionaea muscipula]